ncbi:MAG: OmpA family protein [Cyclobacteriaceae bacterium]|nr:OmpA family protein [Cyclobacteriaceae bacterium]
MNPKVYFLVSLMLFPIFQNEANTRSENQEINIETRSFSFVVIGAFVFQKNAKKYTAYARKRNLDAKFALNPHRGLYYVYSFYSPNKEEAIAEVYKVRDNFKIADAWVYSGQLNGLEGYQVEPELSYGAEAEKATENKPTYTYVAPEGDKVIDTLPEKLEKISEENTEIIIVEDTAEEIEVVEELTDEERPFGIIKPADVKEPEIKEDFKIFINAINSEQLTEVAGPVEIFDVVRNRKLKDTETHTLFGLNDPKNGTGDVKAISRIFGYRPKEVYFNPIMPETDSVGLVYTIGDSVVMDMPLERLNKGDIAVMWNVIFYKDAAIMRPESKGELNSLLEMLLENPDMKIKVHGHTNGNSHGNIVYVGKEDLNFFSLNGDHATTKGSAKKLSEYRAVSIQSWLQFNGIDLSRMEVKGWGGDKMLHGKHDPKAYENVRVEVEIIEDGR